MLSRFLLMAGCAAFSCVQAQVQTELPEIVVRGNPASADLAAPAQRLSGAALLERPRGGLGETLSGLPGVDSSYFGSTASRPIIRGLDGDRIRILNNGATASDVSGLSFDHAVATSPLALEGIEVVRGPAALVYSGSAVGGVVNTLDNRIAKSALFDQEGGKLGRVQAGYATGNQERTGAAMLETGTDKFALHIDAFGNKSGEANAPIAISCTQGGVTRVQNKICNSQAESTGGALGGSVFFDHGYLGASVDRTTQLYGSPAEANVNLNMERTSYRLEGEQRNLQLLGGLVRELSGHVVSHSYQHRELNSGAVATTFQSTGFDGKLQTKLAPFKLGVHSVDTVLGWQQERLHFVADGTEAFVPRSLTQSQALYGLQAMSAPWGKLTAGARLERADVNSLGIDGNANFTPAARRFSSGSLALGGLLKLDAAHPGLSTSVDVARSSRIPKDYELYAKGEHSATGAYEQGDANLAVERSTHVELGLKWQADPQNGRRFDKTSLNVFQTRFDNYIFLQATGATSAAGNPVFQYAATPARFTGWEWTGNTRLVEASKEQPRAIDVEVRASSMQATNMATNQPLPRIAPLRVGLDWTLSQAAWKWTLGADKSYEQNRVAANQPATAGYTLWSAGVSFEQKNSANRALWFAKLRNAGNALAYPATSILTQTAPGRVPLPGRSLQMGVQVSF